jgi:hypothetical protein
MLPVYLAAQPHKPHDGREPKHVLEMIDRYELGFILAQIDFSEEKTVRFVAKRKEFKQKRLETLEAFDALKEKIHSHEKEGIENLSEDESKELVEKFLSLKVKMDNLETDYLSSLTEFLTYNEVFTVMQLEVKVRDEIRKHLRDKREERRGKDRK